MRTRLRGTFDRGAAAGIVGATVAMGFYLWRGHPRLRQVLAENPFDQTN